MNGLEKNLYIKRQYFIELHVGKTRQVGMEYLSKITDCYSFISLSVDSGILQ